MDNQRFKEIAGNAETQALDGIWSQLGYDERQFPERKELFLHVLGRLLREERIRLHKNGVFLSGSIEEQIDVLRKAFPLSEEDADRRCTKPGYEPGYQGFGMNVWWFIDEECPAGVAWRTSAGTYQVAE